MTPADRLRQQAAELLRLADELDDLAPPAASPAIVTPAAKTVSTDRARAISGRSYSSLYRDAKLSGFGWQLPSGAWLFDERALRAFYRKKHAPGESGEFGEGARIDRGESIRACSDGPTDHEDRR